MRNEYGAWKVYKIPIESTRLFLAERNLIINKKERKKKETRKLISFCFDSLVPLILIIALKNIVRMNYLIKIFKSNIYIYIFLILDLLGKTRRKKELSKTHIRNSII